MFDLFVINSLTFSRIPKIYRNVIYYHLTEVYKNYTYNL